ncbi:hypothetical protein CLU81_3989 [Flavobacterium sp. 9]|uniref:hypothetical protein n=1 Tax=Flavobacterium sp. 9 TaxID=2035198 RepID=UPI000C19F01E|nr:hypothetical protein [Flavobacterium sp. 9]PIF33380.1 hypothetical protein CLU81_3989 [Flavobacterium sp. 9]
MKKKVFVYHVISMILLLTTFASCENSKDENPVPKGPQITCEYFGNLKPSILDYNANGLNIGIKIDADMQIDNVKSYEITYGVIGNDKKRTIQSLKPFSNNLNTIIADSLVCGLEYEITASFSTSNSTCLSTTEYFTSQKSYPASPWCAGIFKASTGYDRSAGITINNKPFIIFGNNSFYGIENQSVLSSKLPFPLHGNSGTDYAIFAIGKYGYFKSDDSANLYRYDSDTDNWENLGSTNIAAYAKYYGGSMNGIGYFFDNRNCYQYDIQNNTFTKLANYQQQEFINTFQTNSNLYVINKDLEILQFNSSNGNWEYLSTYPGNKSEDIVSFVYMNKAYIGLSHRYYSPNKVTNYDIYELDLDTKNWKQLASFPYKFSDAWGISGVSSQNNGYIIYRDESSDFPTYVWRFNPSEIVYKKMP